ncbi:MAG: hypothetical protein QM726_11865 [Chitinophagaceae bacterium]
MELDDFKILLKNQLEESIHLQTGSQLEASLRQQAGTITNKIKSSIWFEFAVFALASVVAVVCWFFYPNLYVHLFCIATILFCIVFGSGLLTVYKKITYYESQQTTVKESLETIIDIVSRFTRLYFKISMGLLPVIFAFGFIALYIDISKQGLFQQFHFTPKMILSAITFIIIWSALIYILSKWYIRKLYGNYLHQLKQQLKDIENG